MGLIVPSTNTVMEPDLYNHLPSRVTLHTARMLLQGGVTIESEERMLDEYLPANAKEIGTLRPDVVVFGCTSAGALRGPAYEHNLSQELTKITGAPTVTIMEAVVEELRRLAAKRVALLSPYSPEVNETIQRSLEASGFQVVYVRGMDLPDAFGIAGVRPEQILEYVQEHLRNIDADCLFISCANLRSLEVIDALREMSPIPVVTSNQAVLEAVKRVLDLGAQDLPVAVQSEE